MEYKFFGQITRNRLLNEMLRATKAKDSGETGKMLIMDKLTVKIIATSFKMTDVSLEGFLVGALQKRREPMPHMDAIYFMQPLEENVNLFLREMSGKFPLYRKAYVFFSSPAPKDLVDHMKKSSAIYHLRALVEMNLEYIAIDNQAFVTGQERALDELFGKNAEISSNYNACLNTMATRIATVFASLREFPFVRFHVPKSCVDASSMAAHRDLVPTKLASAIWNQLVKYKSILPDFPQQETCELLIVDRSIDLVAPFIHEWTYDAMCHDLLDMEDNKYLYEVPSRTGLTVKKEVFLDDHDPIWLVLRGAHVTDACDRLHEMMTNLLATNKAAQCDLTLRTGCELSSRDLQRVVAALPSYEENKGALSLHVEIAQKLIKVAVKLGLHEIGKLEQDLVSGHAGVKELIVFLRKNQDVSPECKLRLLMIYAAIHQEKLEGGEGQMLLQLAKVSPSDIIAVNNVIYLGGSSPKMFPKKGFSLKFDLPKKLGSRKERHGEQENINPSKAYPVIEGLIEKLSRGELPKNEYLCVNDPVSPTFHRQLQATSVRTYPHTVHKTRPKQTPTWAHTRNYGSGDSSGSFLRHTSNSCSRMGQRIFIFIIGGATRSELNVAYKLTSKLKREVILGTSSLDNPTHFMTKMKLLNEEDLMWDQL